MSSGSRWIAMALRTVWCTCHFSSCDHGLSRRAGMLKSESSCVTALGLRLRVSIRCWPGRAEELLQ
eukprot:15476115-Alexandrium_andersonii.AAC.1